MNTNGFSALGEPAFHVWMQGGPFACVCEPTARCVSVDVSSADERDLEIGMSISLGDECRSWEVSIGDVPGKDALVAMRNSGVITYGERSGLWMINTGEHTPSLVKRNGPCILTDASAKVFWYLHAGRFVCPAGYYGAYWVRLRKSVADDSPARIGLALSVNGSWVLVQFDARTLAFAMANCGYLKPFGIQQRNWQVRLPSGVTLCPLRSIS